MKRKNIIIIVIAVLVVIIAAVAIITVAVNKSQTGTAVDTSNAVATDAVAIKGFAFSPGTITVKAGTTVTWTNNDAVRHSVTSDDGAAQTFDSGLIDSKSTYSFKFDKPGTYHYHCTPHPYMKAVVIVTAA